MCQPGIEPWAGKSAYFYVVMALSRGALAEADALYLCSCTYVSACRTGRANRHSGARMARAGIDFGTFEAPQWIRVRCFASPRNDVRTILRPRRLACLKAWKVQL
jgi:hypothetical protein